MAKRQMGKDQPTKADLTWRVGAISQNLKTKDMPLEAARGIAALVTVANHAVFGFMPKYLGVVPGYVDQRLQGGLFYILINGSSAVSLFFVLSGYVLTRRYCMSGDMRLLVRGAAKRWPRLMGPVLVTVLISYSLFYFHLYYFEQAGAASGLSWLTEFGGAFFRDGVPDATSQSIHLRDALLQGSFLVFFRGDFLFDGSLWTMHPEILGSFIALGAAPILLEAQKSSTLLTVGLTIICILTLFFLRPELAAFPIGVCMAVLLPRDGSISPRLAYPLLALAVYLLGYPGPAIGIYSVFAPLLTVEMPRIYPQIAGAAILIGVIETFPPIRRSLSGRLSAFLGELSFPIYLLHMLVIGSVGCKVYLMAGPVPAIISVFVVSILASLPLMKFNAWWVGRINVFADLLLKGRRSAAGDSNAVPQVTA